MFYSIRGRLIFKSESFVVIECAGVGYRCYTSQNTMNKIGSINSQAVLYTQLVVREDAMELYGFYNIRELELFKLLCTVSGVGAKVALAILSELRPEQLALAVSMGDSKMLTRASGVGNKLAQRIILEMKDKIKKLGIASENTASGAPSAAVVSAAANISQAVGALAVLGYTPDDVIPFMTDIDPDMPVEQIIAKTLRAIGKKN